jgi:hypothetical protein
MGNVVFLNSDNEKIIRKKRAKERAQEMAERDGAKRDLARLLIYEASCILNELGEPEAQVAWLLEDCAELLKNKSETQEIETEALEARFDNILRRFAHDPVNENQITDEQAG